MELEFKRSTVSCLDTVLQEVQNTEQTLELKLSEGMPDIGHIISAWGQVITRGKEWRGGSIAYSGGCLVWVLYAPEDGSEARVIDGWMPFQLHWDLPMDAREGDIRVTTRLRNVDARSLSARKMLVRAGVGVLAEACSPGEAEVFAPDAGSEGVELLRTAYPLRLDREAGEKTFLLDEELSLPDSAPRPEEIISFRMTPKILDKKVLSNKTVFRGSGNLHLLYRAGDGSIRGQDFDLPFSQFAELQGDYSGDAGVEIDPEVTALELEIMDDGRLRLKGGLVAQFLVSDRGMVELIEDAYAPGRQIQLNIQTLEIPTNLDSRRDTVFAQQTIPMEADMVMDVQFWPDFPVQRRTETGVELELPGIFQVLCMDSDGTLRGASTRWTGQETVTAGENSRLRILPGLTEAQAVAGGGQITVKAELPLDQIATTRQSFPMVTGVEMGQPVPPDPARPSLVIRRAGTARLWDMAKANGTTMEAIRKANQLQDEPSPGEMLLIPIL